MKLSQTEVKFVGPSVVDVFTGSGWLNWTRFRVRKIKGKVYLEKVGGNSLDSQLFKTLCSELETVGVE